MKSMKSKKNYETNDLDSLQIMIWLVVVCQYWKKLCNLLDSETIAC